MADEKLYGVLAEFPNPTTSTFSLAPFPGLSIPRSHRPRPPGAHVRGPPARRPRDANMDTDTLSHVNHSRVGECA